MSITNVNTLVSLIWGELIQGKRQYLYYNKRKREPYNYHRVISDTPDLLLASFGPNDYGDITSDAAKKEIHSRTCRELNKIYEGARIKSSLGDCSEIIRNNATFE